MQNENLKFKISKKFYYLNEREKDAKIITETYS